MRLPELRAIWRSSAPVVLVALVLLAGGCKADQEPAQRGRYYWGGEVNVVCPCGLDLCYWVRADAAVLDPLKQFVQRQTDRPYQPVFITYQGHLLSELAVGFAANYDGLQRIEQVLSISLDLPEDCREP